MTINPPLIKLELSQMKHSIVLALADYNSQISDEVTKQLEAAIEEFDFGAAVQEVARDTIQTAIESYFKYGQGHDMIYEAISMALNSILEVQSD